jgi:hypothetical protein
MSRLVEAQIPSIIEMQPAKALTRWLLSSR